MALTAKVESLQKQLATNNVEHALDFVRQLANRPVPLLDNHALEQLEQLADTARETGHKERKKYHAIFRQCKPLARGGRLASVITRLLGDPEEKQVTTQIQKLLKLLKLLEIIPIFLPLISRKWPPAFINAIADRPRATRT